jgi:hypothetical protein
MNRWNALAAARSLGRLTPHAARLALALVAAAPAPAIAHEFWLSPSRYAAGPGLRPGAPGEPIELSAAAGTGFRGERKPWSPDRAVRFLIRAAHPIDLVRAASPGSTTWMRFAPSDDGGAMVGFESSFLPIELPAAQFDAYLDEEGLDGVLASRRRPTTGATLARSRTSGTVPAPDEPPGRERYRRCAKLWLAGRESGRATEPLGLPLELVPASAPGADPRLRVRILAEGKPLAGALVKAWRSALASPDVPRAVAERDSVGPAWRGRSDARGEVTIPVEEQGEWLVSVVRMIPSQDRAVADWESTWASLTFVKAEAARRPAASSKAAPGTSARRAASPSVGAP